MSAAEALRAARDAGIGPRVDGVDLVLEASARPPAAILELLTRHKADLIVLLQPGDDGWSADDWRALYDERAGIAEFDGGLSRPKAEALAYECCVVEWLNRNPVRSSAGHCLGCGESERSHECRMPFRTAKTGHARLHHRCRVGWHTRRNAEAAAALAVMGIRNRSGN